jgi:hypothetical protein
MSAVLSDKMFDRILKDASKLKHLKQSGIPEGKLCVKCKHVDKCGTFEGSIKCEVYRPNKPPQKQKPKYNDRKLFAGKK